MASIVRGNKGLPKISTKIPKIKAPIVNTKNNTPITKVRQPKPIKE